ncbi:MAG: hypothetical protein IIY90_01865 [Oscillospiraceae bacterium]|nr:hypothetical protein [Oscillospiraceae bacterium]
MKKNDIIRCASKADVRQMMQDLSRAGFHAVAGGSNGMTITITEVPETRYMVQARDGASVQKAYCDTKEEADYIYEKYTQEFELVEMLEGYPGEWKSIAQTW